MNTFRAIKRRRVHSGSVEVAEYSLTAPTNIANLAPRLDHKRSTPVPLKVLLPNGYCGSNSNISATENTIAQLEQITSSGYREVLSVGVKQETPSPISPTNVGTENVLRKLPFSREGQCDPTQEQPLQPNIGRPTSWEDLTTEERTRCRGARCPIARLGKQAWFVDGHLLEVFDAKLEKILRRLVQENHRSIFKRAKSALNFTPLLLGGSDAICDMEPTILLLTGDEALGVRAQNIISRSSQYRKHCFGFKIVVEKRDIHHPAADDIIGSSVNMFGSISGTRAFVRPSFPYEGSGWTATTIGGLLIIRDRYYALTVAHCLLPNGTIGSVSSVNNDKSSLDFEENSDSSDSSDSEFYDIESDDENQTKRICEEPSTNLPPHFNSFDVYLDNEDRLSAHLGADDSLSDCDGPGVPVLIGQIKQTYVSVNESIVQGPLYSLASDWALVPINDTNLCQPNRFYLPEVGFTTIRQINSNGRWPSTKTYFVARSPKARAVSFIGPMTNFIFPWSNKIHKVYSINIAVDRGESGGWVIDADGYFYGMAVATVPSLSLTFILPAEDLLSDIASRWTGGINLNLLLPKPTLISEVNWADLSHPTSEPREVYDNNNTVTEEDYNRLKDLAERSYITAKEANERALKAEMRLELIQQQFVARLEEVERHTRDEEKLAYEATRLQEHSLRVEETQKHVIPLIDTLNHQVEVLQQQMGKLRQDIQFIQVYMNQDSESARKKAVEERLDAVETRIHDDQVKLADELKQLTKDMPRDATASTDHLITSVEVLQRKTEDLRRDLQSEKKFIDQRLLDVGSSKTVAIERKIEAAEERIENNSFKLVEVEVQLSELSSKIASIQADTAGYNERLMDRIALTESKIDDRSLENQSTKFSVNQKQSSGSVDTIQGGDEQRIPSLPRRLSSSDDTNKQYLEELRLRRLVDSGLAYLNRDVPDLTPDSQDAWSESTRAWARARDP